MNSFRRSATIMRCWVVVLAVVCAILCVSCSNSSSERTLLVFTAASLKDVMSDIGEEFRSSRGVKVEYSFAGSQTLARQIVRGAPADVFISAGETPMQLLEQNMRLQAGPVSLVKNKLVLVSSTPGLEIKSVEQLRDDQSLRVAVADPALAPAGGYTKEALSNLGVWNALAPRMIFGTDVRTTLAYIRTGAADVALVYSTDAATVPGLTVHDVIPPESHTEIIYPAAVIRGSNHQREALDFLDFLAGDVAREIFRSHGFQPY